MPKKYIITATFTLGEKSGVMDIQTPNHAKQVIDAYLKGKGVKNYQLEVKEVEH